MKKVSGFNFIEFLNELKGVHMKKLVLIISILLFASPIIAQDDSYWYGIFEQRALMINTYLSGRSYGFEVDGSSNLCENNLRKFISFTKKLKKYKQIMFQDYKSKVAGGQNIDGGMSHAMELSLDGYVTVKQRDGGIDEYTVRIDNKTNLIEAYLGYPTVSTEFSHSVALVSILISPKKAHLCIILGYN
jgi:hypothetical protein